MIGSGKKVLDNKDEHQNSVLDQTSDSAQDLSRRSSLKSPFLNLEFQEVAPQAQPSQKTPLHQ